MNERIGEVNQHEFQAKMLALADDVAEIKADVKQNGKTLAAWPAICAEKRIELERRMANGTKSATTKTTWIIIGVMVPIITLAIGAILALG